MALSEASEVNAWIDPDRRFGLVWTTTRKSVGTGARGHGASKDRRLSSKVRWRG